MRSFNTGHSTRSDFFELFPNSSFGGFPTDSTTSAEPPATYTNERSEPASIPGRLQCHVRRQILMPLWQVRLNGKNFWLRMNGSPGRFGFYTTRYVEATDA